MNGKRCFLFDKMFISYVRLFFRFLGEDPAFKAKLSEDDFIVKIKDNRTVINKLATSSSTVRGAIDFFFNKKLLNISFLI